MSSSSGKQPHSRPGRAPARTPRWLLALAAGVAASAVVLWSLRDGSRAPGGAAEFVDSARCIQCHEPQHTQWQGSHHDLAMAVATPESVLGDFDNAEFTHHGVTSRFYREGEKYFVRTQGADGIPQAFEIKWVFGWTPLQQYLIDIGQGRIQCLQVSWDTIKKRWFMVQEEPVPAGDVLHWTGMQFNWNFMCAECHSTNLVRGYDEGRNGYHTTWSEIDVGCQACHGPGSRHIAWAEGSQAGDPTRGLDVRFKGQDSKAQIDHCARCHSRRAVLTDDYHYGHEFLDHFSPSLLVDPLYFPDGQILDEVYVYGSFVQTKKYQHGVRCTDCHNPHSARLEREGNATCTHCHREDAPEKYPTLKRKAYDVVAHLLHAPGTPGSRCVDCHMPERTYMGVDPRRDHSFHVPRPDLSLRLGTPNACNGCHTGKSAQWAVDEIRRHYPDFEVGRMQRPHFADAFSAARQGSPAALAELLRIASDVEAAAIVRATAVHHLAHYEPRHVLTLLVGALEDPDALVRGTAAASLGDMLRAPLPPAVLQPLSDALHGLLEDPLRFVRSRAARALVTQEKRIAPEQRAAYEAALAEWVLEQESQRDRPSAHLNLAVLDETRGRDDLAATRYLRAIELDAHFLPARFNYAMLLNRLGRNEAAEAQLMEVVRREPEGGEGWYSLGLLRAERKDIAGVVEALRNAVRLMPSHARVRYNQALALAQLGELAEAEAMLDGAIGIEPGNVDFIYAQIGVCLQRGDPVRAAALRARLAELAPESELLREVDRMLREPPGR